MPHSTHITSPLPVSGPQACADGSGRLPTLGPGTGLVPGQCTHTSGEEISVYEWTERGHYGDD